jgi:hypothetical protein
MMRRWWWKALLLLFLLLYPPFAVHAEWINGDLFVVGVFNSCDDAGSTDAYACTPADTRTAQYTINAIYAFKANTANTGAATFNYNGLGPKPIKKMTGAITTDLADNDIRAGQRVLLMYDGTNFQMLSQLGNLPPALAANGANCLVAGTFPNGVDASGAAENCVTLSAVNPQTSTYQVLAADFDNYKTITVASGTFTMTLVPSGSQPAAGKYITILNYGTGVVTVARSGQNLNGGVASLTIPASTPTAPTSMRVISDGTNYFASLDSVGTGAGGGNVSNSGTPVAGQLGQWVTATTIKGVTSAVQVAGAATGGAGTSGSPWTGWDTALFASGGVANTAYYFAPGVYSFSGTITLSAGSMAWIGSGKLVSILNYTGSTTAILVSNGAATMDRFTMQDFGFRATNTTAAKVMLDLHDVSNNIYRDLDFGTGTDIVGGPGSICIRTGGRELTTVTHITTRCEKPIVIGDNPNSTIDIDHWHFSDLYLNTVGLANQFPMVTINDGVILTDVIFDGFQAWVGGTYGLYWNETAAAQQSFFLLLKNIRWEQQSGTTGWAIWIDKNATTLRHLHIDNLSADTNTNFIHLRNVSQPTITNVTYAALATGKAFLETDSQTIVEQGLVAVNTATTTYTGQAEAMYIGNTAQPIMAVNVPTSMEFRLNPTTLKLPVVASAPGTCTVGQVSFRTSDSKVIACTATNTWSIVGP